MTIKAPSVSEWDALFKAQDAAYYQGMDDCKANKPKDANPYKKKYLRDAWNVGWDDAQKQVQQTQP